MLELVDVADVGRALLRWWGVIFDWSIGDAREKIYQFGTSSSNEWMNEWTTTTTYLSDQRWLKVRLDVIRFIIMTDRTRSGQRERERCALSFVVFFFFFKMSRRSRARKRTKFVHWQDQRSLVCPLMVEFVGKRNHESFVNNFLRTSKMITSHHFSKVHSYSNSFVVRFVCSTCSIDCNEFSSSED